jgi:hypothetical protein
MAVELERRRHERYPFERILVLHPPAPLGALPVIAHDVSESGLSFTSAISFAVGDHVVLALRGEDELQIHAEVRNVRRNGTGWIIGAERVNPRSGS